MRQGSVGLDAQTSGSLASSLLSHVHRVPLVSAQPPAHISSMPSMQCRIGLGSADAPLSCVVSPQFWDVQAFLIAVSDTSRMALRKIANLSWRRTNACSTGE